MSLLAKSQNLAEKASTLNRILIRKDENGAESMEVIFSFVNKKGIKDEKTKIITDPELKAAVTAYFENKPDVVIETLASLYTSRKIKEFSTLAVTTTKMFTIDSNKPSTELFSACF